MTQPFPRILVLTGALLAGAATQAAAQDSGRYAPRTLVPPAFPRWDVGASLGLLAVTTKETDASWHGWEQKAEFRADVGRYWTTHLKTEVAVSASNAWHDFDAEPFPVAPGLPLPGLGGNMRGMGMGNRQRTPRPAGSGDAKGPAERVRPQFVYLLKDGVPTRVRVEVGASDGRRTAVKGEGIGPGTQVVVDVTEGTK